MRGFAQKKVTDNILNTRLFDHTFFHPFICNDHWFDKSFVIKIHPVDAGDPGITVCFGEWPAVINDKPFIFSRDLDYSKVAGTGSNVGILL